MTNVALASVTITASTGAGTVTLPLTHADVASAAGFGIALVPQPEVGEAVANGQSVAVGLPYAVPWHDGQGPEYVECEVNFPTLPTAAVVALQGAMVNLDANYVVIQANVTTVAGSAETKGTTQVSGKWNFLRYSISGTGGSGTIVAKIGI